MSSTDDPKHWYDRAAMMRTIADMMSDPETRAIMFRLAGDYDKLGDRAAGAGEPQNSITEPSAKTGPAGRSGAWRGHK